MKIIQVHYILVNTMTTIELPLKALIEEIKSLPSLGYKIVWRSGKKGILDIVKHEDERKEAELDLDTRLDKYLKHFVLSQIKQLPESIKLLKKIPEEKFYVDFAEVEDTGEEVVLLEVKDDKESKDDDKDEDKKDDDDKDEKEDGKDEKDDEEAKINYNEEDTKLSEGKKKKRVQTGMRIFKVALKDGYNMYGDENFPPKLKKIIRWFVCQESVSDETVTDAIRECNAKCDSEIFTDENDILERIFHSLIDVFDMA